MTFKHKITGTQAKLAEDGKYYIHNCSIGIPKQLIENHTHWLKEYGYEILSFMSTKGCFAVASYFTAEENFKGNSVWKIFSVKRISDGVVFSIGDKVKINSSVHVGTIYSMIVSRNSIYITFNVSDTLDGCVYLEDVHKVKEPILVTKDAAELFEGDTYYSLGTPNDYWRIQKHTVGYMEVGGFSAVGGDLIFAKKENAEN
jgi:hypothetical protein